MNTNTYEDFLLFAEETGIEFPVTVDQFYTIASEFIRRNCSPWNQELLEEIMDRGCGPDWR